jgi:hypothetical protein
MPPESPQPQISYAPPVRRTRRLVRRLWLPTFLLLFVASACWWGPALWWRLQINYWYGRCLEHAIPSNTVVAQLDVNTFHPVGSPPRIAHVPNAWWKFYALLSPPGFQSSGTAFLGGRRTPAGREVLVAVDTRVPTLSPWAPASERDRAGFQFHMRAFTHAGLPNRPTQVLDSLSLLDLYSRRVQLLAGVPDAQDPTHFTIDYTTDEGRTGRIDGWVRENGIDLESTPPSPLPVTRPLPVSPG